MKTLFSGIAVLGMLMTVVSSSAWGQTLPEINTALKMSEELNEMPVGPTGGAGRVMPAPRGPVTGPAGPRPVGPSVPAGPVPAGAEEGEAAAPRRATGAGRTVMAPENGFVPTTAGQLANLGFEHMNQMRFDEAREAYRRAKELDSRYETVYQGIVHLTSQIAQHGAESVGQIVVAKQPVRVTLSKYYGW